MRPVVSGLQKKYGDRVAFAGVDFYNGGNTNLAQKYEVFGHPTFVVLDKKGQLVDRFSGYTEEADLEASLRKAAGSTQ